MNGVYQQGPVKKLERVQEKSDNDYKGDFLKVIDIVRASAVFHTLVDLHNALLALKAPGGKVKIVRSKDRVFKPLSSGYRDVLLNITIEGCDMVVELQLHLKDVIAVKEGAHRIYDMLRTAGWEKDEVQAEMLTEGEVAAAQRSRSSRRQVAPALAIEAAAAPNNGPLGGGGGGGDARAAESEPGAGTDSLEPASDHRAAAEPAHDDRAGWQKHAKDTIAADVERMSGRYGPDVAAKMQRKTAGASTTARRRSSLTAVGAFVVGAMSQQQQQWGQQQQFQWGQQQLQQSHQLQQRYERRLDQATTMPYYYDTTTGHSMWTPPAGWQEPSEGAGVALNGQAAAEDDNASWE